VREYRDGSLTTSIPIPAGDLVGAIVYHNHPNFSQLSQYDIRNFMHYGLAEVQAINPQFTISIRWDGWETFIEEQREFMASQLNQRFEAVQMGMIANGVDNTRIVTENVDGISVDFVVSIEFNNPGSRKYDK
jgi:hypothetical protein